MISLKFLALKAVDTASGCLCMISVYCHSDTCNSMLKLYIRTRVPYRQQFRQLVTVDRCTVVGWESCLPVQSSPSLEIYFTGNNIIM